MRSILTLQLEYASAHVHFKRMFLNFYIKHEEKDTHTSINRCSKSKILIVFRYHKLSTCCKAAVHNYSFNISWASQCSVLAYSLWQTVFSSQSYKHLFNVISKLDTPCKYLHFITPPPKKKSRVIFGLHVHPDHCWGTSHLHLLM